MVVRAPLYRCLPLLLLVFGILAGGHPVFAEGPSLPLRMGPELQLNQHTFGPQARPEVAALPGGRALVVWDEGARVIGRLFDGLAPLGDEFVVNATAPGFFRSHVDVCASSAGTFVVTWGINVDLVAARDVMVRIFDADGNPLTGDISASTEGFQQGIPRVACAPSGEFAVTWPVYGVDEDGSGIVARVFERDGTPRGPEFLVNEHQEGIQRTPDVGFLPDGRLLLVWASFWQEIEWDVFGRVFEPNGTPAASEFRVNQEVASSQFDPSLAVSRTGRFVVAWTDFGLDGHLAGISARWFGRGGRPLSGDVRVNLEAEGNQTASALEFLGGSNRLFVAWTSAEGQPLEVGVFSRLFLAPRAGSSPQRRLNESPLIHSGKSAVASLDNRLLVVWESYQQDGSVEGVFGRLVWPRRSRR